MSGKIRHAMRSNKREVKDAKLTTPELIEFHQRKMALDASRNQFLMVEESYYGWLKTVRVKYNIKASKFNIDGKTGALTPVVEKPVKAV
jgi:hypothetical protein